MLGGLYSLIRLQRLSRRELNIYPYLLVGMVLIISQLAVPYIAAPSFQLLLGVAFYPLLFNASRLEMLSNVQKSAS